jgi:molecular chaperone DnaK
MSNKILGIDLGTGFSCIAVQEGGNFKVLPNKEGQLTTPSIVAFTETGEILVGVAAKRQAVINPSGTITTIKRLMGHKFKETKIQDLIKNLPYKVVEAPNGDAWVEVRGKQYSPQEISSMILADLKKTAEDYLGEKISRVVISTPAYFDNDQKTATKVSGEIAGFNVERIIAEPTAGALAFGVEKTNTGIVCIPDIGSGTTDFSIIEIGEEGVYEVRATSGDSMLGGSDITEIVVNYLADEFKKETGVDLRNDKMALQRLLDAADSAKIELSSALQTDVNLPFITADASGPKHLNIKLTRSKFETLIEPVIVKIMNCCKQCIKDAGIKVDEIDQVVLVGGSTRVPAIQKALQDYFKKDLNRSVNPDEAVALGCSRQAAILRGDVKDVVLLDVTPLSLGIETAGGIFTRLVDKNTTIPVKKSQIFSTFSDNQPAVTIRVASGEREMFADNKLLGQFDLIDIPPAPRGVPQIEVTLDLDTNGILHVSAKDKATGKEQSIRITSSGGLTKEEIERMIKEAELNAEADKKKKEEIETRNHADALVASIKKTLSENGEKLPSDLKSTVEEKIKAVEDNMNNEDISVLKTAMDELQQSSMKIGEELYKAQQAEANVVTPDNPDDGVVDAEFKAV